MGITDNLSKEAIDLVCRDFKRGRKSRRAEPVNGDFIKAYGRALDELHRAKIVRRQKKPRHPDIYLFRGSDKAAEIWEKIGKPKARAAVPPAGHIPPSKPRQPIVEPRMERDPMLTDAEYYHRRTRRPHDANVGKMPVQTNMLDYIGGFARFKNRTDAQMRAAAELRNLHSTMIVGGSKSIDYEAVRVDTSGPRGDLEFVKGETARRKYREAMQKLGLQLGSLVENVVIYDKSIRLIAKAYGYGESGHARNAVKEKVTDALDILAVHWGYVTRKAA